MFSLPGQGSGIILFLRHGLPDGLSGKCVCLTNCDIYVLPSREEARRFDDLPRPKPLSLWMKSRPLEMPNSCLVEFESFESLKQRFIVVS